jgi:C-terminal peptidase prc
MTPISVRDLLRSRSRLMSLLGLAVFSIAAVACGAHETAPIEAVVGSDSPSLASQGGGVPIGAEPNRAGAPTSGEPAATVAVGADGAPVAAKPKNQEDAEDDEDKDYWAAVPFDRTNFEEVRGFVRERYIEANIDEGKAFAQAATFALGSDEDHILLLLPESFYTQRKDHPDEKGRLKGKMRKLKPTDRFVVLDEVEAEEEPKRRLSDEEIQALRDRIEARNRLMDESWEKARFTSSDFDRVMEFAARELGKSAKWTLKKAWVAAAQGYMYSLDPHSSLIAKEAWEDSTKEITDSSFDGIGALLTKRQESEYTIVESPLVGQPAVAAGLRAGDVILKVDGHDIKGELLPKVVNRIRGKRGSTVNLTVEREGMPEPFDIAIVRSRIDIKNVQGDLLPDYPGVGYIKVTGFVPTTMMELKRNYAELQRQAPGGRLKGLVLDLRNNSGGLLKQGIEVADAFLRSGVIVTVKNRTEADETYKARPEGTWDVPLVVLVNDGSASASEIVASAIQDNGRGLIVGDRTFGKASVQTLFSPLLRDDYYIKLTVARYYSPSGRTLQVVGVRPDIATPPEIDGKMPLGFREQNLSHHLAPLDSDYTLRNAAWSKEILTCGDANGKARALHARDPNPAVKFDFQKIRGADLVLCMSGNQAAQGAKSR